jgi:biotin operon repressor
MEDKWLNEKENLERLINIDKVSYEEIGRKYGCSGANIKKQAKKLGIELP